MKIITKFSSQFLVYSIAYFIITIIFEWNNEYDWKEIAFNSTGFGAAMATVYTFPDCWRKIKTAYKNRWNKDKNAKTADDFNTETN